MLISDRSRTHREPGRRPALTVLGGALTLATIAWFAWKGRYSPAYYNPVHVTGLYWHFVDIVWIFLYPLLYLISSKKA